MTQLCQRPPKALIAALLGAALTELRFLATPVHAAVAETVAAARVLDAGAAGFANAVLRRFLRERDTLEAQLQQNLLARLDHPAWLIERFEADWPEQLEAICAGGNRAAPMWLRVDPRQGSREDYQAELAELGIEATAPVSPPQALLLTTPVAVERLPGFAQGRASLCAELERATTRS